MTAWMDEQIQIEHIALSDNLPALHRNIHAQDKLVDIYGSTWDGVATMEQLDRQTLSKLFSADKQTSSLSFDHSGLIHDLIHSL